jgi:hypothetical protein
MTCLKLRHLTFVRSALAAATSSYHCTCALACNTTTATDTATFATVTFVRALCRTLAEKMGGTVGFVDNTPHGTVMTLRVPANLHMLQQEPTVSVTASLTASVNDGTCWQRSRSSSSDSSSSRHAGLDESSCEQLLRTQHILVRYYLHCKVLHVDTTSCMHMYAFKVLCVRRHCCCVLAHTAVQYLG